ncbi:MAG: glycine--tRNA ligase, partial [Candidatus Altiarchaeota archaeon]|nr:glycine--tRNA ligase [Candidatus Altiarchaeota archaeon]
MTEAYDRILDIGKRRGIVYPSFEIYGGLSGFIDYGPVGSRIKQNIEEVLRRHYIVGLGCYEVQCPTVSPEEVWIASGHVGGFADVMVECMKCSEAYRADKLLEETGVNAEGKPVEDIKGLLVEGGIKCQACKGELGEPFKYNLMFQTSCGTGKRRKTSYLRPETAQTTYLAFRRLWEFARRRLPFGVIQIGHSFRNEISPRQGMLRLREFNQAEIQFFTDPQDNAMCTEDDLYDVAVKITDKKDSSWELSIREAYRKGMIDNVFIALQLGKAIEVFTDMGVDARRLTLRQHREDERAFYSSDTWDVEYVSDVFGNIELVGIADRSDYDLSQHMKASKQDMQVNVDGRKFVPHVVEVAYGIDRPIYCVLESCYAEESDRAYFRFPKAVAPYLAGVFSLVKKDGLKESADEVFDMLRKKGVYVFVDHAGSIGKRYARADEIGVPYSVTVDYDTLKDE